MSDQTPKRVPSEINLHSKSRMLIIEYTDGKRFELSCEYLRVFSRAMEVRAMEGPITGKEKVNITKIKPLGRYAVRLVFDDGHDTGIYSWDTLYDLGENKEKNWQMYLKQLEEIGYDRNAAADTAKPRKVKLLYFTYLVKKLHRESEEVELSESVKDVASLIEWVRRRNRDKAHLFKEGSIQVTVNKQFSEPFTLLEDGDEIAFIPTSPIAPVAD